MEIIPVFEYPAYSESVVLEGKPFRFSFSWNTRGEYWSLTLSDSQGGVLLDGLKLVLGFELINEYADGRLPQGALLAADTTGTLTRIGRDDLGAKVKLFYIPAAELADLTRKR